MAASNRIALVTGAGTGIGRCTAIELLREEFCVVQTRVGVKKQ